MPLPVCVVSVRVAASYADLGATRPRLVSTCGSWTDPPAFPAATALKLPFWPVVPAAGCQVYVPWMALTSGVGTLGPERTKNIHARAKTIARAMRITAKLGGRRLIRPELT